MKQIGIGLFIGIALTALLYPLLFKKQLEESRLLTENANIERLNRMAERLENKLTPKTQLKYERNINRKQLHAKRRKARQRNAENI